VLRGPGLFGETIGSGDEVVLVHGWGMSSGFMKPFGQRLCQRFRVTLIDLPGHGHSGLIGDLSLAGMSRAVLERAPRRAHWVGWSLGALVALQAAAIAPDAVRSLGLLAGTPRFVAAPDWPGVDESVLSRFAADLQRDYDRTIARFLALQLHGMDDERELLKALRATLAGQVAPEGAALMAGLAILRDMDLRASAAALSCPVLMLLGRRDRLIPAAVGAAVSELNGRAEIRVIEGAAHIPFWTHAAVTLDVVVDFLARCGGR